MTSEERDGATEVAEADPVDPASRPPAAEAAEPIDTESKVDPGTGTETETETDAESDPDAEPETGAEARRRRREHPTFESLTGFYTGLVLVLVVPGGGSALLTALLGYDRAGPLFPYLALVLLVPLALLIPERTRRFARYMLLGAVLTAVVVLGVGALTFWLLLKLNS